MKWFFPLLLFTTLPVFAASEDCRHDRKTFRCVKYVRNYDADTITFNIPEVHPLLGDRIAVRVRHIDTPEIKGKAPCEKEAARTAKRLIENILKRAQRIDLEDVGKDKYFRILADVRVDGRLLSDVLMKNNLALAYEGKTKTKANWCQRSPAALE
ncbi:MAG: thermonuclease family protein [Bdellovibrionaceae bacterium]|nr:thermonuclease family protein [Pseudobdellovibrionaceae bacterium]MBX3032722.1 thermonuclease family protein [Pseudobdellovibrionaceae bacterium]